MSVRMRVAPLPIVSFFPLAGMIPFVILDVPLFQITMPGFIFGIFPLVSCHGMILGNERRSGYQQT